jgi:hypothetical protein
MIAYREMKSHVQDYIWLPPVLDTQSGRMKYTIDKTLHYTNVVILV